MEMSILKNPWYLNEKVGPRLKNPEELKVRGKVERGSRPRKWQLSFKNIFALLRCAILLSLLTLSEQT